jgi:hypothetical protein
LKPTLDHWHAIARKTKKEFDAILQYDGKADHSFWYLFYSHLLAELEVRDDALRDTLVSATRVSANWCDIRPRTRESLLRLGQRYPLAASPMPTAKLPMCSSAAALLIASARSRIRD